MVIIWSKDTCGYCDMAKRLLAQKGIIFEEKKIGYGYTKEDLLNEIPNARTVPQIIIDGKVIGGYNELNNYFNKGN
jgi:glutaredoxin|tara:strand:+ start:68 stop:295 length:228 start_codon:yes stop_codon:yes gene_type:complete